MAVFDAYDLISLWERDQSLPVADKALCLLALAHPGMPREQLEAMTIGARERALLAMRRELCGEQLDGLATCSQCGEQLEISLRVSDLLAQPAPAASCASITAYGVMLSIRIPTVGDALLAARTSSREQARRALLCRCIVSAERDNQSLNVAELDDAVLARVSEHLEELDPLWDIRLSLTCSACAHDENVLFEIASFLWSELVGEAERLLEDVRALGREYGWREVDVLAMSGKRRQFYLDRRNS